MAIEVFPDSPRVGMSPRISFSHDLSQNDVVPIEHCIRSSSSSSIDFDFCVFRQSFDHESYSSADELFSDGKILPIEIKKKLAPARRAAAPPLPRPPPQIQKTIESKGRFSETEEKQSYKSTFWGFKRSSSCGNGYARTLCPLPLLSRSNSTGSTSSAKISNNQKQSLLKNSSPNSSLKQFSSTNYHQKPPLKKSSHGFYSNGVKINSVLNVPPANLFGLGSIFSSGKDRSKKK